MHLRTAFITHTHTPSHSASLLLTFAMASPSHLFTASNYILFSHGVVDRMSRLKKMRLTTTYPRMAFTKTSLGLPPHAFRVSKIHMRILQATWRTPHHCVSSHCAYHKLVKTFSSSSHYNLPSHRLHQKLVLSFTFALRLQHALSHCASLELTPHAASSTLTLLTPWRLRTAFIISTFTLRLAATISCVYITCKNALARCLFHRHPLTPLHFYLPSR